jgi:tRNA threonylcarbamoyladenosine biosynthesis protein TsaB
VAPDPSGPHPSLLALDSSTDACSAALLVGGATHARFALAPRQHTELLPRMIAELLAEAGISPAALDGLILCHGPGAFTGLRIAAGLAQGYAIALGLPIACVSTLATLAQGGFRRAGDTGRAFLPALDARMGEVYFGAYAVDAAGLVQPLLADLLAAPGAVPWPPPTTTPAPPGDGYLGLGGGYAAYGEALSGRLGAALAAVAPDAWPEAQDALPLGLAAFCAGRQVDAAGIEPLYLRNQVAHLPCVTTAARTPTHGANLIGATGAPPEPAYSISTHSGT